jgi:hypothetical protein
MPNLKLPSPPPQRRFLWLLTGISTGVAIGFVASLYQIHLQDPNNEMPWVFQLGMRSTYSLIGAAIGLVVGLAIEVALSIWRR